MVTTDTSLFCSGIQSDTEDNFHIFMADFDVSTDMYCQVIDTLRYLQKEYSLSDIIIYTTLNGYHAFSLDKLELEFLSNILYSIPIIDEAFTFYALNRGFFVLRWGNDKIYTETLYSQNHSYTKSLAHYKFFTEITNTPLRLDSNFDEYYKFNVIVYRSDKHGWFIYDLDR